MLTKPNTMSSSSVFSSYTEQILSRKEYAKIHSVFPNGFNLNFNGELIYMSAHQQGKLSARGLTIDKKVLNFLCSHISLGEQVRLRKNQIVFYTRAGILTIELTDRIVKDLKIIPITLEKLEKIYLEKQLENMDLFSSSGFSKSQNLLNILSNIQKTKEIRIEHINPLIGAGIGLTPTGDDFLQGLIFTEQLLGKVPHIRGLVQKQLAKRSTTDISMSYYEAIFEGYGNEPLILLIEAIREENQGKIKQALSYVQQYGETSGYDLLTGILTYLQII